MTAVDRRIGVFGSAAFKLPCNVATTEDITLSGLQTVDGVVLAEGDRVLVKDQDTATQNGVYVADSGAWVRAMDFNGPRDVVKGTLLMVISGDTFGSTIFQLTTTAPTIGTTSLAFAIVGTPALFYATAFMQTMLDDLTAHEARGTLEINQLPAINPCDEPYNAVGDGVTNEYAILQQALDDAVDAKTSLVLPAGKTFACGQKLLVNEVGSVSIFGFGSTSAIRFTNAESAGLECRLRAYDAETGIMDRVFLRDFAILAGADHSDAAVAIVYSDHIASARQSIFMNNIEVRESVLWGDVKFRIGLYIYKAYLGVVENFSFIGGNPDGGAGYADAGILIRNSLAISINRPQITYCTYGIWTTTGEPGLPEPQCEGIHVINGEIYNVAVGWFTDGNTSLDANAIDQVLIATHMSCSICAIDWRVVFQSQISPGAFYQIADDQSCIFLYTCANVEINGGRLIGLGGVNGNFGAGVRVSGASSNIKVALGYLGGFDYGVVMEADTLNNTIACDQIQGCTVGVSDLGTHNRDRNAVLSTGPGVFLGYSGVMHMPYYRFELANIPPGVDYTMIYVTDGRRVGDAVGEGRGLPCYFDGTDWIAIDSGDPVEA